MADAKSILILSLMLDLLISMFVHIMLPVSIINIGGQS